MKRTNNKSQYAFTLIELLVVIAVIGVLFSMVVPVAVRAKEKARSAHCISNKDQLIKAWSMYVGDNQDYLPPVNLSWGSGTSEVNARPGFIDGAISFYPWKDNTNYHRMMLGEYATAGYYLGSNWRVFKCPEDNYTSKAQRSNGINFRIRSVAMNENLGIASNAGDHTPTDMSSKIRYDFGYLKSYVLYSQLKNPGRILVFSDSHPSSIYASGFRIRYLKTRFWAQLPGSYHNNGTTINFADGHVELKKWKGGVWSVYVETEMSEILKRRKWLDLEIHRNIPKGTPEYDDWRWFVSRAAESFVEL